ncbi:MAG: phosphatase PAP2 family protein [Candidatus Nitronauta litoralis]|uniref:Phosphatase PAP2 family protein n=1 Tax=Candidatus Nitronauta litoralis TaxID=2705533 RepID=A0A7T0BXE2_9BACT|nr:MAG: phosphatase PAP2 family protein [Candidatus Nitronauta litoralis]
MIFVTETRSWVIPAAMSVTGLFVVKGKKAWPILIAIGLAVCLNDFICHSLLKEMFQRIRPCQAIELPHAIYNCSTSFSFPSNHASNSFTLATLIALLNRNIAPLTFTLAGMVSISRVYLGVHYPTDILGGATCGIVMGYFGFLFYQKISPFFWPSLQSGTCTQPLKKSSS